MAASNKNNGNYSHLRLVKLQLILYFCSKWWPITSHCMELLSELLSPRSTKHTHFGSSSVLGETTRNQSAQYRHRTVLYCTVSYCTVLYWFITTMGRGSGVTYLSISTMSLPAGGLRHYYHTGLAACSSHSIFCCLTLAFYLWHEYFVNVIIRKMFIS